MATRIRTLNFLPEIFKTPTNAQFLSATLDQVVAQPNTKKIEGYIGSKFGYGINAKDYYVTEPTKTRKDYQLDPGVVFTKPNESVAQDFISYPGILDALKLEGANVKDNNRLFNSEFYSWDSFTDLDKIINFNQYYWIPEGPERVVVSSETVFTANDYNVFDNTNGYNIVPVTAATSSGSTNPTLTLIRGGTYTFAVNQSSQFWIQGEPGVTGFSPTQPNLQTRDVYGVDNNGASVGVVTFTVPAKNAQSNYDFPGNNLVDLVSTVPFSQINGQSASSVSIDGVTSLNGLTVMFYNTGEPNEVGYVSNFYDYTPYDQNNNLTSSQTITVTGTSSGTNSITCNSTANLIVGSSITFTGASFGGLSQYSATLPNTIYYVKTIISSNQFTVSLTPNGSVVNLITGSGSMTGNINQGLFEQGFYTTVSENFYTIQYIGDPSNYIIRLVPSSPIPIEQKITANFGSQWGTRNFYKNTLGVISLIPYLSAQLDTLYYQDGTSGNKVGIIKLISSNLTNTLDVENDILGKTSFTATNGVVFTNGLKVSFQGDVIPVSYKTGEYYVEGVGSSIELVPVTDLICPEDFTSSVYIPWDTIPWGMGAWEGTSYIPVTPDYITITRNSIDKNAWSRSNRWFHIDVINATAQYNNNPNLATLYTNPDFKAKRPIIEFYADLKLFNSGVKGKPPVDFIDTRTTDAFSLVAGQENYYPDIEVYTASTGTINSVNYTPTRQIISGSNSNGVFTTNTGYDTTGFRVNDLIIFDSITPGSGITAGGSYYVAEIVSSTQFKISSTKNGSVIIPSISITGPYQFTWSPQSTTITIAESDVTKGTFAVGQYIADSTDLIPKNSRISQISGTTTLTLTVEWEGTANYFPSQTNSSFVASTTTVDNYALFDGSTVIFAADTNPNVKNKIYVSRFSSVDGVATPVITLTEIDGGLVLPNEQTVILRGYYSHGNEYWYTGTQWLQAQTKLDVNQPPLFDVFDKNDVSFGNADVYVGTSFSGCKLFAYGIGSGLDDSILGFPIRYSSIDNVGDITFDVSLNIDTFNYVNGTTPITQKVNTGYVFSYKNLETRTRQIGWQTAVSPSIQYQIFEFSYDVLSPTTAYICDIVPVASTTTNWPTVQVFINNVIQPTSDYVISTTGNSTTITLNNQPVTNTVVQILILSDQVSQNAYYSIPINLNNNPLNADITTANIGDIRGQYQSIFYNNPNTTGEIFGPNNYRDLGNLVPWGSRIIQNSASLALPGTFLRKQEHNLFNSLLFNSREYIKFKTLLVDVVNNSNYAQRYDPSTMLDDALSQITASKNESQPFFWSDMIPSKAAYVSNTYSFVNSLDVSIYPLIQTYDFTKANYNGVLVYLTRTNNGITYVKQLIRGQDYTISSDSPSLTVTLDLLPGDQITIKQYNQTYGSYVPNTPTKLGLYPAFIPEVILDSEYAQPTYFILGHDGSYNRLYGNYDPVTGLLQDFRDQVLLEYELRVYNNLKLSTPIPISEYEIVPGFFRTTDYSYDEWLEMYSTSFLNWVGQNRLNYKKQFYNTNDEFTYNYWNSGNAINKKPISQGYWRGIYQYYYDTTTPNTTPWAMLGFNEQPDWWISEYGPAPYTSDNLVLWDDLQSGIIRQGPRENVTNNEYANASNPFARSGLLKILPVDSAGNLKSPLRSVVGAYNANLFRRDWKVGDDAAVELSYRRSSSYPFDLMRITSLMKPAEFFNLAVDMDNYKYNEEFNQYLVDNRRHLIISDIEIYGSGTPKTSYINWIVDYEKQVGINATSNLTTLLDNLDVRLVYRVAGFTDKNLLKFYVEKGTPNSRNASLLIPDESYAVLLYDNQPFNKIVYSGVVVQMTSEGYAVYGNSQTNAYFKTLKPKFNENYRNIDIDEISVKVATNHYDSEIVVPYSTVFYSAQEVAQFLVDYGAYLQQQGMVFDQQEGELQVNWYQMVAEFLYWAQTGWSVGNLITLNPAAKVLHINKESNIVQPLTLQQVNFVLNQNLYPIQITDLNVLRENTSFIAQALNEGDTISYGQFNLSNFEHGIVFDNVTLFNDIIYNLTTGLRQNRIVLRGSKSADWDGTVNAAGFILNQDNVQEWNKTVKYTKGAIVKYKNKYWTALQVIQPKETFSEQEQFWKRTEYDEIQKGLLPNASTRAYESTLYYDVNQANLEQDADLLSFSLIGYRPRDYMALADLTDITQVNVYQNLIKNKGTKNATDAFKGANLPQGGIDYELYENWAILSGEFGGVLNNNFVEFKLNQNYLTGNPSTVELTDGFNNVGIQQEVPLYSLFNYGRPIQNPDILSTIPPEVPSTIYPTAGYVNFNDVKMSSYFYSGLPLATNASGKLIPINNFYVRDYVWLADYLGKWQVFTLESMGQVVSVRNNLNNTVTVTFAEPHNLSQYNPFAIINFDGSVNGYYIATVVVDIYRVIVPLVLDQTITELTGQGIGLRFVSQKLTSPKDINTLPLLDTEFRKNTVWIDENKDGSWAVFRKGINYQFQKEFLKQGSQTYGSAVAHTDNLGYLISDSGAGQSYRYTYNDLTKNYQLIQTLSSGTSFGATISHSQDIFVISEPTGTPKVHIYKLENTAISDDLIVYQTPIAAPVGVTNWGSATAISGDKNWLYISDIDNNSVHVYRKSQLDGQYKTAYIIDADTLGLTSSGDNFGYSLSTDYYGDTLIVGTPDQNYNASIDNWGYVYVFDRSAQNIEVQFTNASVAQTFQLAWTHPTLSKTVSSTNSVGNLITLNSISGITVNDPIIFTGTGLANTGVEAEKVYYVGSIVGSSITLKTSRTGSTVIISTVGFVPSVAATVQDTPIYVSVNGTLVDDSNYAIVGDILWYTGSISAGDIINVSGQLFTNIQTLTTQDTPQVGSKFGISVDTTTYASEIIIGAPFQLNNQFNEGAVYRFTNGGGKYGTVVGTSDVNVTTTRKVLINGYLVYIPAGNATSAASAINNVKITNVVASAINNKLIISLVNKDLALVNEKLLISVIDTSTLSELGLQVYTQTQVIECPHTEGHTQFGTVVKFNEFDSFIVSAPVGTRYEATTFDFVDDENQDNDTLFDNNATQWIDEYPNAGAVYMFDYLEVFNESLTNVGQFIYAQSLNARNEIYGSQPRYGTALDFNNYDVIIGTPNFYNGQAITYNNSLDVKDWSIYRSSASVVDVNRFANIQIFSAETNNTLVNMDYIDPLQGKILGAARQNIDIVSNVDPARYNNTGTINNGLVWGMSKVGQIWFDTSNVRFVNYHQNDLVYNSKYWGTLFPGSQVAIYTWVASPVEPSLYQGPGIPFNVNSFSVQYSVDPSGALTPTYYFWAQNTNTVFSEEGKTLADSVIAAYIQNPKNSGISYFAPLLPNAFALYNAGPYINANDSVLHIGFSTGTNEDVSHTAYDLIRANFADDFLPGLPDRYRSIDEPYSLYAKMLDSMSGTDRSGAVVPDPYLPKAVQTGVLARPRQSFFLNRLNALKNYFQYANEIASQFPLLEILNSTFLYKTGEFFDTTDYWEPINWWATGYNDSTRSSVQVPEYSYLSTLSVPEGTIATVETSGSGLSETYILKNTGWARIGLTSGTFRIKSSLWDYNTARIGFGDNFFDTSPYDAYPSEETRYIIRALNEELPAALLEFRNKGLILLFQYIQAETIESQNYLTWLNKTSLVDVSHTIRELRPIEVFQTDNQDFLSGYLNEVKPYHVVIKEFLFKYKGTDVFEGNITDFDLPSKFDTSIQKFMSPELVYANPSSANQFLPDNTIWNDPDYTQWKQNYGVSLTGQDSVQITTLESYIGLSDNECLVNNAQGFPINGVIRIGEELIGYASVDRSLNLLVGLTRGVNGTPIKDHIPGDLIYIDLPAALVLNSGRGYTEPPKVTAYIDTTIYPEPTRPAVLEAVMNLDSILRIDVIDPGQGYAVLPTIVIDPAAVINFTSSSVNVGFNTIELYAPLLQTGDLVQYNVGANSTPIGGLKDKQWYYVNLLESIPTAIVALYSNYTDAINDHDRIFLYNSGTGNHSLNEGARASAISTAIPVRENNVALRFDRTTYNSKVLDWKNGNFYGAYYAGTYSNSENFASSSILLYSTQPPISAILASAGGVPFEITNVRNNRDLTFSSFVRQILSTQSGTNIITLIPQETTINASGTTIGFYVGMPINFKGGVSTSGIVDGTTYYINSIVNDTQFTISTDPTGSTVFALNSYTVGNGSPISCYTGEIVDTAVLTVLYPGIMNVTATEAGTNKLTIPLNLTGTGGTNNFYINLPVFFTGDVFGGVIQNQTYYITTVVDSETFTMSENQNPQTFNVLSVNGATDSITIDGDTARLDINEPIIFNTMVIAGTPTTNFGGLISGVTYYVSAITGGSTFKVATSINGAVENLSTVVAASNTSALLTSQKDTVTLTTASGNNMIINVSLPVSPGQVNGQQFTLYETSQQYEGIYATNILIISRDITAVISTPSTSAGIVTLLTTSGGTVNFYVNMPFEVSTNIGSLTTGTTYYVTDIGTIEVEVTNTYVTGNELLCDTTEQLYVGMPIVFSGSGMGGIIIGNEYFVKTIVSSTRFTISSSKVGNTVGPAFVLTTSAGTMTGTGEEYIELSTTLGGPSIDPGSNVPTSTITLDQTPLGTPQFTVSYILGGYRVIIENSGSYSGYAVDNQLLITGDNMGGTSPLNDLTITVNTITSTGQIENMICSGTVPGISNQYYLKVISPNEFEVYENQLLTIPVSGLGFQYDAITSTEATSIEGLTDRITVTSSAEFNLYDPVVFTGEVFGGVTLGQTYYIKSKPNSTTVTISIIPNSTTFNFPSNASGSMTMTKLGSIAFLPEPFYFDQSIVKYNNRTYVCIISNNDTEFIFGKWELLTSGDRRLNALDRIIGYYKPDESNVEAWNQYINMPGLDLSQLVSNIRYPNGSYLGNPFAPAQQWPLDTILNDTPFYPTEVDIAAVVWDGADYIAPVNTNQYSGLIASNNGTSWDIGKIANSDINVTDIIYAGGKYIVTTENQATPIYRSNDGVIWTTSGLSNAVSIIPCSLNSVTYNNGLYIAVGSNIVTSTDTFNWTQRYQFPTYLTNRLYSASFISTPSFVGYIAVGKGQLLINDGGIGVTLDINLILQSTNGTSWTNISPITDNGLFGVTSGSNKIIAVGENGVIYTSTNGSNWLGLNEVTVLSANDITNELNISNASGLSIGDQVRFTTAFNVFNTTTTYYVVNIISNTQIQLSTTSGGSPVTLTPADPLVTTYMYVYPRTASLRDIQYNNSIFMAVGDNGLIKTSSNGTTWVTRTSGTIEDLTGVIFNQDNSQWTVVGKNNTIIISNDNGVTWTSSSLIVTEPTFYDVQGADFEFGYGPEELVPGLIKDNLTMIVATRPGTNWPAVEYQHVGYGTKSLEFTPTSINQTQYVFQYAVQTPAQLAVYVIDGTTGLGTRIYEPAYSVDWINGIVTLATPLTYLPIANKLRIDIYEVGNGNQLVKANSLTDPIRLNNTTGFNEIYVNCNYSASVWNGGGIIRPDTDPIQVRATLTDSATNTIQCDSVENFVLNSQITFQGNVFGGISEDTPYYVKTISTVTNRISVSSTVVSGIAGPVLPLTDAVGSMYVIQQVGSGLVWSEPIVYHNGSKLVLGNTGIITGTSNANDTVKVNTTSGMYSSQSIVFSQEIAASGSILPLTPYTIFSVVDNNEITLEDPSNPGNVLPLGNYTGGATFITNDYAFGVQPNNIQAKIVFAASYDQSSDYLVYSLFGETEPAQYGYTVPETQLFSGNGSSSVFSLTNYISSSMIENAVVEINGLRQLNSGYLIDPGTKIITFYSPPPANSTIAVTTFNLPNRQYFNTQYGITAVTSLTVANIVNIENNITPFSAITNVSVSSSTGNVLTCASTTGFFIDATIVFKGNSFGGVSTGTTVYFVETIINGTDFTIKDADGNTVILSNDAGLMVAYVGGLPAVRVTTGIPHSLITNSIVRLDQISGSVQLNNNTYYARVIDNYRVDLYTQPYDPAYTAVNYPVTTVYSYTGGGYIWLDGLFVLSETMATETVDAYISTMSGSTISGTTLTVGTLTGDPIYVGMVLTGTGVTAGTTIVNNISGTGSGSTWQVSESQTVASTTITGTFADANFIIVQSTNGFVEGTPVYFTESGVALGAPVLGGLISGFKYYIKQVYSSTEFSVSETQYGDTFVLTPDSGVTNTVCQWQQENVDRLWVTVNGYRVPSSSLRINEGNYISILTTIVPGDVVTITNMIPSATPNEEVYMLNVDASNESSVHRSNAQTRTWLSKALYDTEDTIYVNDVSRLTDTIIQNVVTPVAVNGIFSIGLTADKNIISSVTVYNTNPSRLGYINSSQYAIVVESQSPILKITDGSYIDAGDALIITTVEGNLIYINGEQIRFREVDTVNNTLTGLQRGANNTGQVQCHPEYSEVFGILSNNRITDVQYGLTWNSNVYNTTLGDPLQVSTTTTAIFLNQDIN